MDCIDTFCVTPPRPASDWALFLDVDGCLLDHAASPQAVEVPATLSDRLRELSLRLGGAVALVSGRSIVSLDALFPDCSDLYLAGLHGLESRAGGALREPPRAPDVMAKLSEQARELARAYPNAYVETAGPCLNLHWRGAPHAAPAFDAFTVAALARLPGYRSHRGAHGVEIRPLGVDKGQAIEAFMARPPFAGRRPVFAGDDPADECGFAVVNARDGISVLVGDREDSLARHRLADPARVRDWLAQPMHMTPAETR